MQKERQKERKVGQRRQSSRQIERERESTKKLQETIYYINILSDHYLTIYSLYHLSFSVSLLLSLPVSLYVHTHTHTFMLSLFPSHSPLTPSDKHSPH